MFEANFEADFEVNLLSSDLSDPENMIDKVENNTIERAVSLTDLFNFDALEKDHGRMDAEALYSRDLMDLHKELGCEDPLIYSKILQSYNKDYENSILNDNITTYDKVSTASDVGQKAFEKLPTYCTTPREVQDFNYHNAYTDINQTCNDSNRDLDLHDDNINNFQNIEASGNTSPMCPSLSSTEHVTNDFLIKIQDNFSKKFSASLCAASSPESSSTSSLTSSDIQSNLKCLTPDSSTRETPNLTNELQAFQSLSPSLAAERSTTAQNDEELSDKNSTMKTPPVNTSSIAELFLGTANPVDKALSSALYADTPRIISDGQQKAPMKKQSKSDWPDEACVDNV